MVEVKFLHLLLYLLNIYQIVLFIILNLCPHTFKSQKKLLLTYPANAGFT